MLRMRRHVAWLSVLGGLGLFVLAGCPKKDDKKDDGASTASKSEKKASQDKSADDDDDDDDPPPPKTKKHHAGSKKVAHKGGSGATVPNKQSLKTELDDDDTSGADDVDDPPKDACDDEPEGAAECDGKKLYFCKKHALWVVDCNAAAKKAGFKMGGSCFERDDQVDCMGCTVADDGSSVCCDNEDGICCDDDGYCWKG